MKNSQRPTVRRRSVRRLGHRQRRGAMMAEVLIAGTMVIALAGIVTPLTYRLQRVHADAVNYRMAVEELRNLADRLSAQPDDVERIDPTAALSEAAQNRLPEAKLSVEILQDDLQRRVVLTLNWNRGGEAVAPKLIVWLPSRESIAETVAVQPADADGGSSTSAPKEAEAAK